MGHAEEEFLLLDHNVVLPAFLGHRAAPLHLFGQLLSERFLAAYGLLFNLSTLAAGGHARQKSVADLVVENNVRGFAHGRSPSLLLHVVGPVRD